jgi:glycosyltransferase involved in cell wall biosynthesis
MGGKIRSFHILKQLARRHEITLFTFYGEHPDDQHLRGNAIFSKIVPVPLPLPPRRSLGEYLRSARLMAAGRPVTIDKFLYPEVRRRYAELLASATFDVVVCDFLFPGPLMHWKTPPPTILFTHNVEAQVWERHYKITTNPFMKTACWLESRALAGAERRYVELADHVVTVSENDRAFFLQYVDAGSVSVIPTGVDTEYFQPSPDPEQPDTMAFTGTMDWMPNEDGVAYFVDKILPLIRREIPDAAFLGSGPAPSAAPSSPGIRQRGGDRRSGGYPPLSRKSRTVRRAVAQRQWHPHQDLRGHGHGKGRCLDPFRRRRPSRAAWREHHPGGRSG